MAAKQFIITIPKPCTENWEVMVPGEKGKFCSACQKTVTDFTLLSDSEIIKVLQKAGTGHHCGRFYESQLKRELQHPRRQNFTNYFLQPFTSAFVFFQAMSNMVFAQAAKPLIEQAQEQPTIPTKGVGGYIIDYLTHEPLRGMEVSISSLGLKTTSNENGYFFIELMANQQQNWLTLTASYTAKTGGGPHGTYIPAKNIAAGSTLYSQPVILYRYAIDRTEAASVTGYKPPIVQGAHINSPAHLSASPIYPRRHWWYYWLPFRKNKHNNE